MRIAAKLENILRKIARLQSGHSPAFKLPHDEHEVAGMTDKLHDIREAASRLAVSPWTVRRLVGRGDLRGVRVGRRVLVSEKEILRVIQNGCGDNKRRKR